MGMLARVSLCFTDATGVWAGTFFELRAMSTGLLYWERRRLAGRRPDRGGSTYPSASSIASGTYTLFNGISPLYRESNCS